MIHRLTQEEKRIRYLSEEKIVEELEEYEEYDIYNLSRYYFPGQLTAFYPNIKEYHASKDILCDFSESIIRKGNLYISYRPLIENLDTHEVFVLKRTIKCECFFEFYLPSNIFELESLNDSIINYSLHDDEIHYQHLHYQQGGELILQKMRKKNNVRKRKEE